MNGIDPRALRDVLVPGDDPDDNIGTPMDYSAELRRINEASMVGDISSPHPSDDLAESDTPIRKDESLGSWLCEQGCENLAASLGIGTARAASASTSLQFDRTKLATPEELIAVFGVFTGMNANWFNQLNDKPNLKRARKQVGQGQRGNTSPPLFCPYEVMLWLVSKNRKAGTALSVEKGWELLEKNFPSVYADKSIGDPRE